MNTRARLLVTLFTLLSFAAAPAYALPVAKHQAATAQAKLEGRWRVKFMLSGVEKTMLLEAKVSGVGSFFLLNTGPDNAVFTTPAPLVWSQLTNNRVTFSGDAELPLGTCCREIGTLVFKGKFQSDNTLSGRFLFVTSVDDEESPYKYRALVGTFTATRATNPS